MFKQLATLRRPFAAWLSVAMLATAASNPTPGQPTIGRTLLGAQVSDLPLVRGNAQLSITDGDDYDDPLERLVSLQANQMPLRQILQEVCRQGGVPLELDTAALEAAGLELDKPVTRKIDAPLGSAIHRLTNGDRFRGIYTSVRDGRLFLSTIAAHREATRRQLPDWLKPLYNKMVVQIDDSGNVVRIGTGRVITGELMLQIKTLPQLRELEIAGSITPAGIQHLAELKSLERLELHSVKEEGKGLGDNVIRAARHIGSLRELSIFDCGTTDAGVKLLEDMPQLTHLRLEEGQTTDLALDSISNLKQLRELHLASRVGMEDQGGTRFTAEGTRKLENVHKLEELSLVGSFVPPDLRAFPSLRSLNLSGEAVDDVCAAQISQCRHLESLTLSFTEITDAGLSRIAAVGSLQRLDLSSNIITDAGITHLKNLPRLQHLQLCARQLTDESLRHVAAISTISYLDLGGRDRFSFGRKHFTAAGIKHLRELRRLRTLKLAGFRLPANVGELTQVRYLHLWMMGSDEELAALQDALPHTRIMHRSGSRGMFTY